MADPHDPNAPQINALGPGEDRDMQSRPDKVIKHKREKGSARKAVTKQEAEALVQDFRNRRNEEKRQKYAARAPRNSLIRIGLATVCGVVAMGTGLYVVSSAGDYEEKVAANNAQINELREAQKSTADDGAKLPEPEVVTVSREEALKRGNEVIKKVKDIAEFDFSTSDNPDEQNRRSVLFSAMTDELEGYFSTAAVNSGTFKVLSGWYVPYRFVDGVWSQMPADEWGWNTQYVFDVNPDGSIPVVFENRVLKGEFTDEVGAIVVAQYNPSTRKFTNLTQHITEFGVNHAGASSPNSPGDHSGAAEDSLIDDTAKERGLADDAKQGGSDGRGEVTQQLRPLEDQLRKDESPSKPQGAPDAKQDGDAAEQPKQQPQQRGEDKPVPAADKEKGRE